MLAIKKKLIFQLKILHIKTKNVTLINIPFEKWTGNLRPSYLCSELHTCTDTNEHIKVPN